MGDDLLDCGQAGHDRGDAASWVRQAERNEGLRPGLTSDERTRVKELERENRELRRANEILKSAAAFFGAELDRRPEMIAYIDAHKERFGVEPICKQLPIAPSTYYAAKSRPPSARTTRDEALKPEIRPRAPRQLRRLRSPQGLAAAQPRGNPRGPLHGRTPHARPGASRRPERRLQGHDDSEGRAHRPADLVERDFRRQPPNQLWVADITYVATWNGFVYVAFVTDVFSRRIVGWRVSRSLRSDLALDALEMALWARGKSSDGLVHHSDRGSQYLSIRYTERLAEAGAVASVGSRGDSYDNALAESDQRALQDRADPTKGTVEDPRRRRVRHPRMGRLVQQPTPARTDRRHPAGRIRNALLDRDRQNGYSRTQRTESPLNPGRFMFGEKLAIIYPTFKF